MNPKFKVFHHVKCEFFPCHGDVKQNCLFCYCPLAFLECHGDYKVMETNGVKRKDCKDCTLVHDSEDGWDMVWEELKDPKPWGEFVEAQNWVHKNYDKTFKKLANYE